MGLLRYFWSEMIWKQHLLRNCVFLSQLKMKGIPELEWRLGITGSISSHLKLQGLQESWKFLSHYLECNTVVHGLYKMFLSNQDPYWRVAFLAASYSNYSPCSFTPVQCWPSDLPRHNTTCLKINILKNILYAVTQLIKLVLEVVTGEKICFLL